MHGKTNMPVSVSESVSESKKEYQKKYRESHKESKKQLDKAYYEKHKKTIIAQTVQRNRKNKKHIHKTRRQVRLNLIYLLGGICVQCGFADIRALQIDHIHGGGTKEIRKLGGEKMYRMYLNNPALANTQLQVLCANCNWIKRYTHEEHHSNAS